MFKCEQQYDSVIIETYPKHKINPVPNSIDTLKVIPIVTQIVLHPIRHVISNLVLQRIHTLRQRESTQCPCDRTHSQSRTHPSELAFLVLLPIPLLLPAVTALPVVPTLPVRRLLVDRRRCAVRARIACRRGRIGRRPAIGATVRRWRIVLPGPRRRHAVRRRVVGIRRGVPRRLADGDPDLQLPLRPAGGALQLESPLGSDAEAGVVDDVAEAEPGGSDERLGVLGGVGVDDIDAEGGVLDRGVEGDEEPVAPAGGGVAVLVDAGGALGGGGGGVVDPDDGVGAELAVTPVDVLEVLGGGHGDFDLLKQSRRYYLGLVPFVWIKDIFALSDGERKRAVSDARPQ
ncbi:hypothetical protein STAS_28357 [Striga asiatica]|uniref:Uncharacterized protein n=1 Tax=Striga asiatica TaxID=4170 RepID=A0A5A7R105_STRAF|nr:hypothetical protein STAS_28357 [Striga asiatica]